MLYLIGLGLHDPSDVTVKGLQIIKRAHKVFLESYTSILGVDKNELVSWLGVLCVVTLLSRLQEKYYGRKVFLADRELVEQNSGNEIILYNL